MLLKYNTFIRLSTSNNSYFNPVGIDSWYAVNNELSGVWNNFMICPNGSYPTYFQMNYSCTNASIVNWKVCNKVYNEFYLTIFNNIDEMLKWTCVWSQGWILFVIHFFPSFVLSMVTVYFWLQPQVWNEQFQNKLQQQFGPAR